MLELHRAAVAWDSFAWGYVERWEGTLPPQEEGTTVRYRISAWRDDGPEVWADSPPLQLAVERATAAFFASRPLPTAL